MIKRKTLLTTLFLLSCILTLVIYTPFSEDKFYKTIPTNTTMFFEQQNVGSQINDIIQAYPIKYFIEPYINQKEVKRYRENKKIGWIVNKILSKKTAVGYSKHTGKTGEECTFVIVQINSAQQIAKFILEFNKNKNLVKSKTNNNQKIWTAKIDKQAQINFSFSDGMLIITISQSSAPIEKIVQQLSGSKDSSPAQKAIEKMKNIPNSNRGFYLLTTTHSKKIKTVLFSLEEFSGSETHINLYPTADIISFETIAANEISNMLETLNYYPTCFIAGTPKFFTIIAEKYINIPNKISATLANIENNPTFIATASQRYSGKILKLKTPSIIIGAKTSEHKKEQLIADIIKHNSTPMNKIYLKQVDNNNVNIITTEDENNRYTQQSDSDKIAFTSKNNLVIFSSSYSVLNKIISNPTNNIYKNLYVRENVIAFAVLDIPKTISLFEDYLDVYAIYLIVSSDEQINSKRSQINNTIKPFLKQIKVPGTITANVVESLNTKYMIELKIINK